MCFRCFLISGNHINSFCIWSFVRVPEISCAHAVAIFRAPTFITIAGPSHSNDSGLWHNIEKKTDVRL
jgi:hypothetical protein